VSKWARAYLVTATISMASDLPKALSLITSPSLMRSATETTPCEPFSRPDRGLVASSRLSSTRRCCRQRGSCNPHSSNYLLAQAHVDAPALASSIAHLNTTTTTFSPLQPLEDTDIVGYLLVYRNVVLLTLVLFCASSVSL